MVKERIITAIPCGQISYPNHDIQKNEYNGQKYTVLLCTVRFYGPKCSKSINNHKAIRK